MRENLNSIHPEGLTYRQESLILSLYDLDAVRFGEYRWKVHDNHPEAPPLPIYTDFRMLRREPLAKSAAVDIYESLVKPLKFDLLSDIPAAATPLVSSLSDRILVGQITPRMDIKAHGSGAGVDGLKEEDKGKTAVLIDDLVSFADSKIDAASILREAGLIVTDVAVLMDYQLGGRKELERRDLRLHNAFTINQMLAFSLRVSKISQVRFEEIQHRFDAVRQYFIKLK